MVLALAWTLDAYAARKWTDKSGAFVVEAELVSVNKSGQVLLQRPDGGRLTIKFFELSGPDQAYIRDLAERLKKARPNAGAKKEDAASDSSPAPGSKSEIAAPPAKLGLGEFYAKYLDFQGVAIVSSQVAEDAALLRVRQSLELLLSKRPDILRALAANRLKIVVIAQSERVIDVPENHKLEPKDYWASRTRSIAASLDRPFMTIPEENILGRPTDPYAGESLVVHELAHTVHELALKQIDPDFDKKLAECYQAAKKQGLWENTFAATNAKEYWAEGVQSWFNVNRTTTKPDGEPDGLHNGIDTREKLKAYDSQLVQLISRVFP